MPYLNCPRCSLALRVKSDDAEPRSCPRCVGREGVPIPMYATGFYGAVDELFRSADTSAARAPKPAPGSRKLGTDTAA